MTIVKFPELREFLNEDTRKSLFDSIVEETKFNVASFKDFRPAADVVEADDKYIIHLAVPGIAKEDFKVELAGQRLVVRGERKATEGQGLEFHKREIKHGAFARSFYVPEGVDANTVDAVYKDGILSVTLKKIKQAPSASQVKVK